MPVLTGPTPYLTEGDDEAPRGRTSSPTLVWLLFIRVLLSQSTGAVAVSRGKDESKRAIRRAKHRAQEHGYTWYKGRRI